MEEVAIAVERHEQQIKALQNTVSELREVQNEIRSINETLVTLANELKHTNEHLLRHEKKIDAIEEMPRRKMYQIFSAIVAAISGAAVTLIIGRLFG